MSAERSSLRTRARRSRSDDVVDAAFLATAVTLGLLGFKTTYGDFGYMVGGVLGLIAGIAIAQIAWKLRLPVVAASATAFVAFVVLGAGRPAFHRHRRGHPDVRHRGGARRRKTSAAGLSC